MVKNRTSFFSVVCARTGITLPATKHVAMNAAATILDTKYFILRHTPWVLCLDVILTGNSALSSQHSAFSPELSCPRSHGSSPLQFWQLPGFWQPLVNSR